MNPRLPGMDKKRNTLRKIAGPVLLMFDLDGTLVDSRDDLGTAVNLLRRQYHLPPLPRETVAGFIGDGIRKLVERSLQGHPVDLDRAVEICARHYRRHLHDRTRLYPGVYRGLRALHREGFLLALISNKPSSACRAILRHFKIKKWFSCVMGGGDTEHLKPHPEPLRAVLKKLAVMPGHAWMVGDHQTDLEAARNARVRSVFLTCGIGRRGAVNPTLVFNSFIEFADYFIKGCRKSRRPKARG